MATTIDKSSTIIDANLTLESVLDEETKGKIKEAVERGEAGLNGVSGSLGLVFQTLTISAHDTHQWAPTSGMSSVLKEVFKDSDVSPKTVSGWLQGLPASVLTGFQADWEASDPGEIKIVIPTLGSITAFKTV